MVAIPDVIEHLVFAGGGMRGLAYAGALEALRQVEQRRRRAEPRDLEAQ